MKILIVFGSKSDENVYTPLINKLNEENFISDFHILSAHRNPTELGVVLEKNDYDFIVAGAGLAAHLPGVCASKTDKPVLGIPIQAAFKGLDSFFSILQMPTDVPVACCYPNKIDEILSFFKDLKQVRNKLTNRTNLIIEPSLKNEPFIAEMIEKTVNKLHAKGFNSTITYENKIIENACNINLVQSPSEVIKLSQNKNNGILFHVFMLSPEQIHQDLSFPQVFYTAQRGGLWFGVNNITNAILFYQKVLKVTQDLQLLKKGSVKNILKDPTDDKFVFEFSDRYSIFDWGEMPNQIPNKGKALGITADLLFNELDNHNIKHHLLGLQKENERQIKVNPVNILTPVLKTNEQNKIFWDYSRYNEKPTQTLVPLEVIFRWGLPVGNSFEKRAQKDPSYLKEVGLTKLPASGGFLEKPIIEFSTKLEEKDRYLSYNEAAQISGMNEVEIKNLRDLTERIATLLKNIFEEIDLTLWDGKIEYAFGDLDSEGNREFIVVDSIGPDELRLTYKDMLVSKEFLRQFYKDSSWYKTLEECKIKAKEQNRTDWKKMAAEEYKALPSELPPEWSDLASRIYTTVANALSVRQNKEPFFEGPTKLKDFYENVPKIKL